jgi:hypothetical protein
MEAFHNEKNGVQYDHSCMVCSSSGHTDPRYHDAEKTMIEQLRQHLIEVVKAHGFDLLHPEVVSVSQTLDEFIVQQMKKEKHKGRPVNFSSSEDKKCFTSP